LHLRTGYHISIILLVATLSVVGTGRAASVDDSPVRVAIVSSDTLTSTQRTLSGAEKVISRSHPEAFFSTFLISKDLSENQTTIDSLKKLHPKLILTVGSSATQLAHENFHDIPIVFSAVKYPVLSGFVDSVMRPGSNITGASLDIPTDIQFTYFKKIIPNIKKIGVLYTANTASLIPQARVVAQHLGLDLIAVRVNDDKSLPEALDSLTNMVQGIWSVADENLFKPKSTRYILLNTLKKGIPFMGFSRYVVESGALFALDFDYKAVGLQAGAIANKVIDGEPPSDIQVTSADVIWFHYNENTAKRINIVIPEELAAIAKEVYR
jgi:putative ABC transport system substrate-binding protein